MVLKFYAALLREKKNIKILLAMMKTYVTKIHIRILSYLALYVTDRFSLVSKPRWMQEKSANTYMRLSEQFLESQAAFHRTVFRVIAEKAS